VHIAPAASFALQVPPWQYAEDTQFESVMQDPPTADPAKHIPAVHDWPIGQVVPHAPQFVADVLRFWQVPAHIESPAAQVVTPASSGWKPTPTVVCPFGTSVRLTLTTCCPVSEACVALLIQVACVADMTVLHAPGYASPTNVSRPSGNPVNDTVALVPATTFVRLVTLRAPVTSISTQPTSAGTCVIAAFAWPMSSPSDGAALHPAAAAARKREQAMNGAVVRIMAGVPLVV
jgi:hypothetical protein